MLEIKMQFVTTMLLMLAIASMMVGCSKVDFSKPSDAPAPVRSTAGDGAGTGGGGGRAGGTVTQPGGDSASGEIVQGAGPNGGDVSNSGGTSGGTTGVGNMPVAELPKVKFIGPPCLRLTECEVTFQLDKTYSYVTEFDWKTNDTLYGTVVPAGLPPWGKPGFTGDQTAQYVPTSGHILIPAGQSRATVHVRNINQRDVPISIGVIMSNCAYNSLLESCVKFFN